MRTETVLTGLCGRCVVQEAGCWGLVCIGAGAWRHLHHLVGQGDLNALPAGCSGCIVGVVVQWLGLATFVPLPHTRWRTDHSGRTHFQEDACQRKQCLLCAGLAMFLCQSLNCGRHNCIQLFVCACKLAFYVYADAQWVLRRASHVVSGIVLRIA